MRRKIVKLQTAPLTLDQALAAREEQFAEIKRQEIDSAPFKVISRETVGAR